MELSNVAPELQKAYERIPAIPLHWPGMRILANTLVAPSKIVEGVTLELDTIGSQSVRIYRPKESKTDGAMLLIHGGGLVMGKPALNDTLGSRYAKALGITVVSPQYRLAPKHQAPSAIEDCWSAWQWLLNACDQWGINKQRIVIAGVSAGGGLAANLTHRIADEGKVTPLAQVLIYPMLDDRTSFDESLDNAKHFVWSNRNNRYGWSSYLGKKLYGQAHIPDYYVAARRQNLAGLPPAWIGTGDIDLFYEENKTYAKRLQSQGINCQFKVIKGAPHGFNFIVPGAPQSKQFYESSLVFLKDCLH